MAAPVRITTTKLPDATCPSCAAAIDEISGTGAPSPGDITMCVYCRVFLILTDTLQLRVLTNAEWVALPLDRRQLLTRLRDDVPRLFYKERRPR